MIKAAIFDMDGLLIDSEPFWRRAQLAAFATVDIHPSIENFNQLMGRRVNEVVAHYYHMQPWEGKSQKDIEALIVDDLIAMVKKEGGLKPGVHSAIEVCKQAGLPLAIASSSYMEVIDAVVDTLGLREHFDVLYSAENEPLGKPHPGVFITAAGLLDVAPLQCLVFEDSPSGVLAAKAAAMTCVAVPEADVKQHPFIQTADAVIDSLEKFDDKLLAAF